jgi:hypothetical protein
LYACIPILNCVNDEVGDDSKRSTENAQGGYQYPAIPSIRQTKKNKMSEKIHEPVLKYRKKETIKMPTRT